ncbi:hypothetical protein DB347_17895 [Opitutaceae bacterium EW11]|nr:hypothetical protein DB347_17895 [Opitutaceae bacterium EW11]
MCRNGQSSFFHVTGRCILLSLEQLLLSRLKLLFDVLGKLRRNRNEEIPCGPVPTCRIEHELSHWTIAWLLQRTIRIAALEQLAEISGRST